MASFDEQVLQDEFGRVAQLESHFSQVVNELRQTTSELHHLRNLVTQNIPPPQFHNPHPPPPPTRPNLNLPQPPPFSGNPSELSTFKLKLCQFIRGNYQTYFDNESQLMYAGSLLSGPAGQWYETLVDPDSYTLPPHYTLDNFLQELTEFFGGGITLASRERSLDTLRQTGTVSELAIAFQNITNTFNPRWTDHSLIYTMSKKIRETIRFELAARGTVPTSFQDYIAAAISVEHNQAAANLSRGQQSSQPPRLPFNRPPALPAPSARPPPPPPPHLMTPWIWAPPEVLAAPLLLRSAAAGLTQTSAPIAASPDTSFLPAQDETRLFRPGVFFPSPPVIRFLTVILPPPVFNLPPSLGPSPPHGLRFLPPTPSSLPLPRLYPPRTCQKTTAPANRGLAGRRSLSPHPPPLPHSLPSVPPGPPPPPRPAARLPPGSGRFRRLGHLPRPLCSAPTPSESPSPPPPHTRGAHRRQPRLSHHPFLPYPHAHSWHPHGGH